MVENIISITDPEHSLAIESYNKISFSGWPKTKPFTNTYPARPTAQMKSRQHSTSLHSLFSVGPFSSDLSTSPLS